MFSSEVGATLVPFGTGVWNFLMSEILKKNWSSVEVTLYTMYDTAAAQNLYLSFSVIEITNEPLEHAKLWVHMDHKIALPATSDGKLLEQIQT